MRLQVLLVEDSPGDVRLTQEAFRDANRVVHLHVASDGVEAMAFLQAARAITPMRRARTSSCWISTCPGWTAARSWPTSRTTRA